ncbi:MAG: hypothetical protein Tsb002_10860 [Wenzhouxiangellaceae bacterium]
MDRQDGVVSNQSITLEKDKKKAPRGAGPKQANTDVRPGEDSVNDLHIAV